MHIFQELRVIAPINSVALIVHPQVCISISFRSRKEPRFNKVIRMLGRDNIYAEQPTK